MAEKDELDVELELWRKAGIEAWLLVEQLLGETDNRLHFPSGAAPNKGTNAPTEGET